ncbi:hypothetical protein Q2406_18225 [Klebsiella pneumoniae]|nr:hypothetical protein [Klebsiella pneumoniae]
MIHQCFDINSDLIKGGGGGGGGGVVWWGGGELVCGCWDLLGYVNSVVVFYKF